jgi:hypothetical protein
MTVRNVVALKDVAEDMNDGKAFYAQKELGLGDYFRDSLPADIESLMISEASILKNMVSTECLPGDFPMPSITRS